MIEQEWMNATDPRPMLDFLRQDRRLTERKARLFAVACCRRIFHLLDDKSSSRKAMEFAESLADGLATTKELRGRAWGKSGGAWPVALYSPWAAAVTSAEYGAGIAAQAAVAADKETAARWQTAFEQAWRNGSRPTEAQAVADAAVSDNAGWLTTRDNARKQEERGQSAILLCMFGPLPFRHPPPIPASVFAWNGRCVMKLATAIYEERALSSGTLDNGQLAVLADALEEAGWGNEEILYHLRQQGAVHVCGCWVVDLLLKKE
jgi:hypothetical protein